MITLDLIKDSGLHDYELKEINIDYQHEHIQVKMCDWRGKMCEIDVSHYIFFSMTHDEPWGEGIYITASDVTYNGDIVCLFGSESLVCCLLGILLYIHVQTKYKIISADRFLSGFGHGVKLYAPGIRQRQNHTILPF